MTSEAGALLLGATDKQIRLIERFAGCFNDQRAAELVEHTVARQVGQRVFGLAPGYEDLIDPDRLRHDPVMAVLGGKLSAKRSDCAPLAGKSTLNRLELSRPEPSRYHKISWDAAAIEGLFVELFLNAHAAPPPQLTLDPDATDDPLHGQQEERFFHGYGACPRAGIAGPWGQLLLSAALCVLRPTSVGCQAAPGQYRCERRQCRRDGADRRPYPHPPASGAHPAAC
jgi:hypothetical protein